MPAPEQDEPFSLNRFSLFLVVRGVVMVFVTAFLIAALHYYIGLRLIVGAGLTGSVATAAWVLLGVLFLAIPAGLFTVRRASRRVGMWIAWTAYLWLGVFGLLLSATVATDLLRGLVALAGQAPWGTTARPQAYAIIAVVIPATLWGIWMAMHPRVERRAVQIPGLGEGFRNLKIVQLSDVHIGPTLGRRFLEGVVAQANALDPDIIAITGDLVDGRVEALRDEVAPLAHLKARLGVFFVTGNHEYYSGAASWEAEVRRLGITVLHNEHQVLERAGDRLVLGGITDHDGGHFAASHVSSPALAFEGAPAGVPRILLAHQPRSARQAAPHQVALQLSGHTHGGQMFPFIFFVRLQQPMIRGLRVIEGVPVYTSRGTGYWGPPLRIGARPEIAELSLVPA